MIKKAIVYIFLVLLCLSVSGLVVDKNIIQINNGYDFGIAGQSDDINHYTIVSTIGNVSIINDEGDSINDLVYDDSTPYSIYGAVVSSDGYLYIATSGGIFRRNSIYNTPVPLSNAEDLEDSSFTFITADVSHTLIARPNYIYYDNPDYIKKINVNTKLTSTIFKYTDIPNLWGEPFTKFMTFDAVDDNEIYIMATYGATVSQDPHYIRIFTKDGTKIHEDTMSYVANIDNVELGIQYLNDDAIYYGASVKRGGNYATFSGIINNTGSDVGSWDYKTGTGFTTDSFKTFQVGGNANTGAVKFLSQVEIVATEDKSTDISAVPTAISYDEATINSQYTAYYNNSDLYINTFISIDLSDNGFDNYYDVSELYQYEIDLIDANGVQVESNIIYTDFTPRGILDKKAELTSTQTYTGNYINGTWQVQLYEVTKETQTRALLDDDSFEILNTSSSSAINPPTEISGNLFDRITNNENFGALIIVVAFVGIFASIGAKQEGEKTISGAFMGFIVGIFVGFMAGLVPLWIVLSMVLVSIGLIASGISNKMG